MAQNVFVFPEEDVIVSVPKKYRGRNIIVEKKKKTPGLPFDRTVINLGVHYLDHNDNKIAISKFYPPMEIWVGYREDEVGKPLSYWDVTKPGADKREPLYEEQVANGHRMANNDYSGYGHVVRTAWPADPNLGWG